MITVDVMLTVSPEDDYYFEVTASAEELNIIARDQDAKITQQVNFGSVEEMRAVAKAMLQACKLKENADE